MTSSPIGAALASVANPPATRCNVGRWLETIDHDDRDALTEACRPGRIDTVWKALRSQGVDVTSSQTNWYRHWKGACACGQVPA